MRFWKHRDSAGGLDADLERYGEPREDFVSSLTDTVSGSSRAGRRSRRLGVATVFTAATMALSVSLGGVGYAASAVDHVSGTVHQLAFGSQQVGSAATTSDSVSPSERQYCEHLDGDGDCDNDHHHHHHHHRHHHRHHHHRHHHHHHHRHHHHHDDGSPPS